ncbi:MAG: acetyl-CoA carboxylase biotin carboxylase subunit [Candidatus Izemoplasmataceae bacterium]
MLHKVLIANRGEIAVRIIRACKQMGIETVAVYSKADKDSLHVQLADEAVCIGDNKAASSYLNMENIISAAINTGAEAIHPGFGFLSENASFAALCEECGIIFVGPKSEVIAKMGDKAMAKKLMQEAKVPLVPGSAHEVSLDEGKKIAKEIGYPVLIKASAGGGGKGMRIVKEEATFDKAYHSAKQEAALAFKHDGVYIEKFIENPKHIEVQILADKYGAIIHLGERDCSIQRRNQKVVEEAPSALPLKMKEAMFEAAIKAAEYVQYENAGTIEFIVKDDAFYFIEMNTRIQVEHPVTEMITGVDIVREQLRIAAGRHLKYKQEDITFNGHAIEVRINAEDPKHDFRPSPGLIDMLHVPSGLGIRFDSMIYTDYEIPPFYDSMIGKVIVHGYSRLDAIRKMRATLEELIIEGVPNNQTFLMMILMHEKYVKGEVDTSFIEKELKELLDYET